MELILWRHAEAEDGIVDAKRELTGKGRRQAERMARWLRPRLKGEWILLASPAVRTVQTAEALGLPVDTRVALGLAATEAGILREAGWPENGRNVIVVGHQPTLGRVAAKLLTGHAGDLAVKKGAAWWFSRKTGQGAGPEATVLRAVIGPDFAE